MVCTFARVCCPSTLAAKPSAWEIIYTRDYKGEGRWVSWSEGKTGDRSVQDQWKELGQLEKDKRKINRLQKSYSIKKSKTCITALLHK